MGYVNIPDSFHTDPRVLQAWEHLRDPIGLFTFGVSYAALTRIPFVPDAMVEEWVPDPLERDALVGPLLEFDFWFPDDGGYGFPVDKHDRDVFVRGWGARRGSVPRKTRDAVLLRDGMVCGLCGEAIATTKDLHLDHILPVSRGGGDEVENLQPAHAVCNIRKGNRVPEQAGARE